MTELNWTDSGIIYNFVLYFLSPINMQSYFHNLKIKEEREKKKKSCRDRREGRVLFSHSIVSNCFQPHGLQHTRLPCPSPSPKVCSNSCPLGRWYHSTISSSFTLFLLPQSFPASGSFPVSRPFASGGEEGQYTDRGQRDINY